MRNRVLPLIVIPLFAAGARADYSCENLGNDYATSGQRFGLWALAAIGQSGTAFDFQRLKGPEREALGLDVHAAMAMRNADKRATTFGFPNCQTGGSDGFRDAARHFVLSATLASQLGRARALELLTAHEAYMTKDPNDLPSSLMDLHNNSVGAEFGSRYFEKASLYEKFASDKGPISNDAMLLALAEAFRTRQLRVIKKESVAQSTITSCEPLFKREREILSGRK